MNMIEKHAGRCIALVLTLLISHYSTYAFTSSYYPYQHKSCNKNVQSREKIRICSFAIGSKKSKVTDNSNASNSNRKELAAIAFSLGIVANIARFVQPSLALALDFGYLKMPGKIYSTFIS